jgi:hypothetical protein
MLARRHGRLVTAHGDDGDLNVDVMRFFAIIAMCLFAMLPHTEAPRVRSETDLQQGRNMAAMAALNMKKINAPAAQLLQEAPSPSTDESNTRKAPNAVRSVLPVEQAVVEDRQRLSVPAVSSITRSQREKVPAVESASEQEGGVRFLNSDAFMVAVTSGAITLIYHGPNESLVFDPAVSGFTRLGDESLQIFGLANSEVPPLFYRTLPKIQQADMSAAQWFITLPERTLAYLLDAQKKQITGTVLNGRAQPISVVF